MVTVCERIMSVLPEWMKTRPSVPKCQVSDKCLLVFGIVLVIWLVAVIVSFISIGSLWLKVAREKMSFNGYMKPQCIDDGFRTVTYFSGDRYMNRIPKHVKIFATRNGDAGALTLQFYEAVDMCKQLNATLWEVDSQEEWIAITDTLRETVGSVGVWLNAKVKGEECKPHKECKKKEALEGNGIPVRWKTDKRVGQYSRLYKGETENEKCVFVEDNNSTLWNVDTCAINQHVLLCVKIDCFL